MTIPRELGLSQHKGEIVLTQQPICDDIYELKVKKPICGIIGLHGFARVGFNADKNVVFVNEFEVNYLPVSDELHLKVVIDRSSIELFTGDGLRVISLAVFPEPGMNRELEFFQE
jgi:sucrose-6-phosphate hydrolase SacC (GH32 family)